MLEKKIYEDFELLALLKNGDQRAINLIYNQYWKGMYLAAYAILGDNDYAQDIVQEVLLQLWIRKDEVKIDHLKAYLFTAVRYKVLTYMRSANNRKVFLEDHEIEQLAGVENLNDNLYVNDIKNLLAKEVLALPERCRQVFELSRVEFLTNSQIADRLGITVKAVESQMTIALRRLRNKLSDVMIWIILFLSAIN